MPQASIRGVQLNYEVLGDRGAWVALSPGGRRAMGAVRSLASRVAAAGCRVVIYDRRNCGASDVAFDPSQAEDQGWAEDLHVLLGQLGALPAWIGGGSSGCRLSLYFALRYRQDLRGLLLWRITGGRFAADRLNKQYFTQYIEAAQRGGMAAVCETEHFRECIEARVGNRDRIMAMTPQAFSDVMSTWSRLHMQGADHPVLGVSAEQLRSIRVPACIVPGNDNTHPRAVGEGLARLLPDAELHVMHPEHADVDTLPAEIWGVKESEIADVFVDFLRRKA
jgi:pimeloyl-ACP methyl ester carboxylesterase